MFTDISNLETNITISLPFFFFFNLANGLQIKKD